MKSASRSSCSSMSSYGRGFEFPDEIQSGGESPSLFGGPMLPIFLNDLSRNAGKEIVEVTIELSDDIPVDAAVEGGGSDGKLVRSLSMASTKIRQKLGTLMGSASMKTTASVERDLVSPAREMQRRPQLPRTTSSAQRALRGLRFINKTTADSNSDEMWRKVESRFEALAKDGLLEREDFGKCIGMENTTEFAVCVFDALARRRRQKLGSITKDELRDFWLQISDQSFDARLQIFFDM